MKKIDDINNVYNIFSKAEYDIENVYWKNGDKDIGNFLGDIAELRSKYRKIFRDNPHFQQN